MSLATMPPKALEPVDHTIENAIIDGLHKLLANRGSLRLPFRLSVHKQEEAFGVLTDALCEQLSTITRFKVQHTLRGILTNPEKLKPFSRWMLPQKPSR